MVYFLGTQHLDDLLNHLHQLTAKHVEPTTLDECAQTFNYFLDPDFSQHSSVVSVCSHLIWNENVVE